VVSGNPGKRTINKREPKPKREIPSCPAYLSDAGKVAWGRLGVLLDRMGVLTEADGMALERLCDCYAELLELRDVLKSKGRTYETDGGLIKANPAAAMFADADRRFKSYLMEFGLTPTARSKVQTITDPDDKKDPLDEFFK